MSDALFISYSHKDERWKDALVSQLGVLSQENALDAWNDERIGVGTDWRGELQAAMDRARVAVLLVSADFLKSEFIQDQELPYLRSRAAFDDLTIYGIVIRPCAWQENDWLERLQLRPRDARPLSEGRKYRAEKELAAVTREIAQILRRSQRERPAQVYPPLPSGHVSLARLPVSSGPLYGRGRELEVLDDAWEDAGTNVVSLSAWGGVGKTALVNDWLSRMQADNFRGAARVFGWSFYSQGQTERQVSGDQFVQSALEWFGDADPTDGSLWERGERLARLVRRQPTLLVLDGLEPLQHSAEPVAGWLTDPAIQTLVRELAALNSGLCVLTTRVKVHDLDEFADSARQIDLERLSPAAGAQLLSARGIVGEPTAVERAARAFGGHALTLSLLGAYLRDTAGGRFEASLPLAPSESERARNPALHVLEAYASRFEARPELSILHLISVFDRPADGPALRVLRDVPIAGLNEPLQAMRDADWWECVRRLRASELLAPPNNAEPDTLDAHPLVREYFGARLKTERPSAWREAHSRLFDHLRNATEECPTTLETMTPLYVAVGHGCQAGRYLEAMEDVYWARIQRGERFYGSHTLGAISADLVALSNFLDPRTRLPVQALARDSRARVLNEIGVALQSLGRMDEAAKPLADGLAGRLLLGDWRMAAWSADNLFEYYTLCGDLRRALVHAQFSTLLSDQSGDPYRHERSVAALAAALHQLGVDDKASESFRQAEAIQRDREPAFPILFSLEGLRYCELLMDAGKYDEAEARSSRILERAMETGFLLDMGMARVVRARARGQRAAARGATDLGPAADDLQHGVDALRQSGRRDYVPMALLARADLNIQRLDLETAQADLADVLDIAERASMRVYEADAHLAYARLHLAGHAMGEARASLASARDLVEQLDYARRGGEVRRLEDAMSA